MDIDKLYEEVVRFNNVLLDYERRLDVLTQRLGQMAGTFDRSIADVRATQAQILDEASARAEKTIDEGVRRALGRNWSEFDREVGKTLSRLQEGGQEFIQSRQAANQHVKWLSLKTLAAVAASMAVLIGGGALLLTMELKRVHQAEARLESIEVRADVAEASRHVIITSCGGRPCIRLEADTPRWGRDGEYVLVDGK